MRLEIVSGKAELGMPARIDLGVTARQALSRRPQEQERVKKDFIAMVTHDMRSPLASLGLLLESLSAGVYDARESVVQERLEEAKLNVDRILKLVTELLDFDQLDVDAALTPNPRAVNIVSVIEEACKSVHELAQRQAIGFELDIKEDIIVNADRTRLMQVFVNLLTNAIQYSTPGKDICIRVVRDGRYSRIEVSDRGPGIPRASRNVIFEPYRRLRTGALEPVGSGLGLAICKSIVEAHNGTIGVASNKQGSTFWFTMPLYQAGDFSPVRFSSTSDCVFHSFAS